MSSQLVTVRYPTGESEYELGETNFKVGEILERGSQKWIVFAVREEADGSTVVTLRPVIRPFQ